MNHHPLKLFIEPTTRCNLSCSMCVKQSPHADIAEGNLSMDLFNRLIPALAKANTVILTGIGEPLLHPDLEKFIDISKKHMPENGRVGFQTNGVLMDQKRTESLVGSGVDRICISVDSITDDGYENIRTGSRLERVREAFGHIRRSKNAPNANRPEVGIEFVLMKDNIHDLPGLITWADRMGAMFIIVSNLLPYRKQSQSLAVYPASTDAPRRFLDKWLTLAKARGINLPCNDAEYYNLWNIFFSPEKSEAVGFLEEIKYDAYKQNVSLHMANLLKKDTRKEKEIQNIFVLAERIAFEKGIKLTLPSLRPKSDRFCRFVEENSMFVSWYGSVHPCYFLWHKYSCYRNGASKHVKPVSFGNIADKDVAEIWNDPAFISFRNTVKGYDYPYCSNCSIGPCPLVTSDHFEHDCYLTDVPCGDCYWNSGLFQCLQ